MNEFVKKIEIKMLYNSLLALLSDQCLQIESAFSQTDCSSGRG
jgi:hypothetical protein